MELVLIVYSHWYLKIDDTRVMLDTRTEQQFIELINGTSQRNKH